MMDEVKIREWRDAVKKDMEIYTDKGDIESAERMWALLTALNCVLYME